MTHIANRSFGNKWTSKQSQLCYSILKILTREYAPFSCCVDTRCCYSRYRSVLHQMLFLVYIWHWTSNLSLPKQLWQKYKKTKQNTAIIQSSNPESQFLHWNTWISSLLLVVRYTFSKLCFMSANGFSLYIHSLQQDCIKFWILCVSQSISQIGKFELLVSTIITINGAGIPSAKWNFQVSVLCLSLFFFFFENFLLLRSRF